MGPTQKLEVSFIDKSIAIRLLNPNTGIPGQWEYHPVCNLVSLTGQSYIDFGKLDTATMQRKHRYPHNNMTRIIIETNGTHQADIDFDVADVVNQPTWTADPVGIAKAKSDINLWIAQCSEVAGGVPVGGYATEPTLISVLNAIVATQDVEVLLVRDNGNGGVVVKQVTSYSTGSPVVTYEDVTGAAYVPVGPLVYLDPSAVLNLILAEMLTLNAGGQLLTEATFAAEDFATEATLAGIKTQTDLLNFISTALEVNVTSSVLPTGAATEATLNLVDSSLAAINTDIQLTNIELANILSAFNAEDFASQTTLAALLTELQAKADLTETQPVSLPTGVHSVTNSTVVSGGSVPAGAKKVYFQNIGTTDATVLGGPLEPGISIPYEAEIGKTLPAFSYTASATAILKIVTVV